MSKTIIILSLITFKLFATSPDVEERENWTYDENATANGSPSDLKYFKFYDVLPDDIILNITDKKNLTDLKGKHVFVGYGVVDPRGKDCRLFSEAETGLDHSITICLPWWRIERKYEKSASTINDVNNILCQLPKPKPPLRVNVCKKWEENQESDTGGKVTCTSYYSRIKSDSCWGNPKQAKCFVDNCSPYTKDNCTEVGAELGNNESLKTAYQEDGNILSTDTKINVLSHQYECPVGKYTPYYSCLDKTSVLMYPYTCTPDNPSTSYDDGVYVYCDDEQPQYDTGGNIIGFLGSCPDGKAIVCDVNSFSQTVTTCDEPLMQDISNTTYKEIAETRDYKEYSLDVLSGEVDIYANDPNCVRSNTVEEARDQTIYAHIVGDGFLDDDIYIIRHRPSSTALKVYCNMQHAESIQSSINYNGTVLNCIDNDGKYKFDKKVAIQSSDIISIQQATENINELGTTYFPPQRTSYLSTAVKIDSIEVAPATFPKNYPYYSIGGDYLRLQENSLGNLSILFPYAGAYELYFFNKSNKLLASKILDIDDFTNLSSSGNIKLKMVKNIALSSKFSSYESDDPKLCLNDDWAEIGGGVYGGKAGITGEECYTQDDDYIYENAITKVLIKDLLTGNLTEIPLVFPLIYANRIFVSKLKLYEKRNYRCYQPFSENQ